MDPRILVGDCRQRMAEMPECSVDAIATDPPYGLEFMGKDWDRPWAVNASQGVGYAGRDDLALPSHRDSRNANCRTCGGRQRGANRCACASPRWDRDPADDLRAFGEWCRGWATEALRVLKPGGHLVAFGGTRTWHRLACAIEDAGFEVRDNLAWLYGSGFPKSLDVSKAIDKQAGAERERQAPQRRASASAAIHHSGFGADGWTPQVREPVTAAAAAAAAGWGTALKPAFEPIVLARKPLAGTVAANVLAHGTGALNIDACRIGDGPRPENDGPRGRRPGGFGNVGHDKGDPMPGGPTYDAGYGGRWPANVVLDDEAADLLDEQTGELASGANPTRRGSDKFRNAYGDFAGQEECVAHRGADSGGASRFFYVAKAGADERPVVDGEAHPTVKPLALMRWLIRLVTPPGGTVLDPFLGSGTTAEAALLEGFDWIGCEMTPAYLPLIQARLDRFAAGRSPGLPPPREAKPQVDGQLDLFGDVA
jgi:site-specific DNA-methyltransferase (adenine-specific)